MSGNILLMDGSIGSIRKLFDRYAMAARWISGRFSIDSQLNLLLDLDRCVRWMLDRFPRDFLRNIGRILDWPSEEV